MFIISCVKLKHYPDQKYMKNANHVLGKKITKIPLVAQLVKALIFAQKNCRSAIGQKRYCNSLSPGIV
jgi:hypothetical protein